MAKFSLNNFSRLLWALTLVTLPVTSFRYVPFMGAGTYVRPLALYPLALLFPLLLIQVWRGKIARPWPGALTVLLAFVLAALAATTLSGTFAPIELRGVDYADRAIRSVLTLAIGLMFFLTAVWMNQSEDDLKFSVRWLLLGLVFDLIWSAVQFVGLNTGRRQELIKIQNLFSVRGLVQNKRVSGFAFEPSWLAGQIAALYLPWLAAAIVSGYRVFGGFNTVNGLRSTVAKWIEPILLLGALAGLLITYSRSGLAVAVVAGLFTFALTGRKTASAFGAWIRGGFARGATIRAVGSRLLLAAIAVAVFAGVGVFLTNKGYIAALFKAPKDDLSSYITDAYLGPRIAYSVAALESFQASPWTGVGLGAAGFSIYRNLPDWVLAGQPEIAEQLSPASSDYPNPKNLYVRLLAETGLVAFALFVVFYLSLLADGLGLLRESAPAARWLAAAGLFAFAAIVLQGFSQDSFAMPEIWINLGLLAGAAGAWRDDAKIKTFTTKYTKGHEGKS